ncbi:MAG: hypothetical protein SGI73_14300 [Chloroflexota bacterium]|nr:hypothetical protein [Chloroflexota bacterium]
MGNLNDVIDTYRDGVLTYLRALDHADAPVRRLSARSSTAIRSGNCPRMYFRPSTVCPTRALNGGRL